MTRREAGAATLPAADPDRRRPTPKILIHGNSGCRVRPVQRNGKVVLRKSALEASYSARLRVQIEKQRARARDNRLSFVRIPRIVAESETDGLFSADMEYVYFHNSIDFFSTASRDAIDAVAAMLFEFLDAEEAESTLQLVPAAILLDKLDSVERALTVGAAAMFRGSLDGVRRALAVHPSIVIPVGPCHGDLTFSNIMIANDAGAVALIDFLDSFIESPLIDIAKLRQDTRFNWTLLMSEQLEDKTRFKQVMEYLDRRINEKYSSKAWYRESIDLILAVNMLRIAPYAKTPTVQHFIVNCINSLEAFQ